MERLGTDGVFGAVNAFAVDDDGRFAYLFDPRVDATIRIDLVAGTRDVLVWYDRSFRHRRWLCYCMFAVQKAGSTFLPTLFYNTKRKEFVLVTFIIDSDGKVLHTYAESAINTDCIKLDRLAYNAHIDDEIIHVRHVDFADQSFVSQSYEIHGELACTIPLTYVCQIIFYERFTRHGSPTGDSNATLFYVYCSHECGSHRTTVRKGALPQGQWELPFTAHQYLHFISTEHSNTQLASIPVNENVENNEWDMHVISSDQENAVPPRKAVWCNAWRAGMGWYVVSEKIMQTSGMIQQITVWQLDVLDCQWRLLPVSIEAPTTVRNFALRIENNNIAFLHIDWDREGVFYKFDLAELMSRRPDEAVTRRKCVNGVSFRASKSNKENVDNTPSVTPVSPAEIICPVCLDTYQDPRTLTCGHSICFNCVQQMREIGQSNIIRCFACRKSTVIPACGLPVNFSLRDAIETLVKAKQLKLSGLRCAGCRKSCEDKNLWVCLQCATGDCFKPELSEGVTYFAKRARQFAFCAQCILKQHNKHRVDEYCTFRKRHGAAEKTNEKFKKTAEEILQILGTSITESVEPLIIEPLRNAVLLKLINACDAINRCDETDIICASEVVIGAFRERTRSIAGELEKFIKDLVLTNTQDEATAVADRPTEL